jgi:poly-gamma-glutamate capsule biosynthesis protein CapA/YwtB (metallophosphatase superfamily)
MKHIMNFRTSVRLWLTGALLLLPWQAEAVKKSYTVAAVGDCLLSSRASLLPDPAFLKLAEIVRGADCAFGNCETTLFNAGGGFPAYKTVDPNVYCETWGADEFRWLGLDIMSVGNNHIMDFSFAGLFSTLSQLDRVGIGYAGAGRDLENASRPGYIDTAAGVVALVSASSWIPEKDQQASRSHPYMNGRPGLNPLNTDFFVRLDTGTYEELKSTFKKILTGLGEEIPEKDDPWKEKIDLGEYKFLKGDKIEETLVPDSGDMERVLGEIKAARNNSRLVIATLHQHIGLDKQTRPTRFQEEFARQCIDAGADIFIGTGPHVLWGIEIYKGKPIFYSLGNFFFQELRLIAPEAYQRMEMPANSIDPGAYNAKFGEYFTEAAIWESFVPVITYGPDDRVQKIQLYPLAIDPREPLYQRGVPMLAEGERAKSIINRLGGLSQAYRTSILYQNGTGMISLPAGEKK